MRRPSPENAFRLLADQAVGYAFIVMDEAGTIVDWSTGAERLLGWSAAEAIGQPAALLFTPEDRLAGVPRAVLDAAAACGSDRATRWHARRDGAALSCEATFTCLAAQGEAASGFGALLREHGGPAAAAPPDADRDARLRRTQTQLRLATEAAQLGIWTWDTRRDLGTWENQRMYDIFNVPAGQPVINGARMMADYLHPDDVEPFRAAARATLEAGARFSFTGRFYRLPERELRWLELSGILQPGGDGIVVGTAADITERKLVEETAREDRLRVESALAGGDIATWVLDIPNDRVLADDNLYRLFGVPPQPDLPLAEYVAAIHPDDLEQVGRQIGAAIESGAPYEAIYRVLDRSDGQVRGYRWVHARGRVTKDENGQPAILAGITFDITPQQELHHQLRVTQERYRTLITSMDEAFGIVQVLVDADGKPVDYRFEDVNAAFEQQSGLVDAAGKTIREMVPNIEPHWIEIYGRVALTREPARFIERAESMGYAWNVYATPIGAPEERRIAILFTDVTARLRAEDNLRQVAADLSEANRRKTEFLATLAHELRNPLAPLRTGLDLMRMTGKVAQGGERVLEMMDRQLRQLVHLIDDLMDVSRINSGKIVLKKARLDLWQVVTDAVETVLPAVEAAHHQLSLRLPERAAQVEGDATRLVQILANLLTNAVKYTPNGGAITLSAQVGAESVAIAVTDSGIGIPLEEQAGVFEMFSQVSRNMGRAQGGLGIGLSLVRSLVAMHGGAIAVASAGAGQGTTFTLTLPLAGAAAEPAAASAPATTAASEGARSPVQGVRVLVADDNVDAAHMLCSLLQATGHAAEAVHDGRQALRRIVESAPELAILDIGMPGLNGYEVAQAVRATPGTEGVTLVALTGWGGELDRSRSERAGFAAHLTKPASLADLDRLMARMRARPEKPT